LIPAWHTHGSPDGQWILGDDHDRSLWLICADTRERRMLTTGHATGLWKTHPHASFTPDRKAILLNSSYQGNDDVLLVKIPDNFESLPLP
jgi:oligogalacturonide lyase